MVLQNDALGLAGRAGGIEDVGQVLRPDAALRVVLGALLPGFFLPVQQHHLGLVLRQPAAQVRLRQQHRHLRVVQQVRQPLPADTPGPAARTPRPP